MRAVAIVVAFVLAFALSGDASADAVPFVFHPPAGWNTHDDATRARDATQAASRVTSNAGPTPVMAATNPDSASGLTENVIAIVRDGASSITMGAVRQAADVVIDGFQKSMGTPVTIVESRIVSLRGVDCGNLTYEYTTRGVPVRTTSYILPGDRHTAIVTFTAHRDDFERHRALYEATVAATEGIKRPPDNSVLRLVGAPLVGMIIGTGIRQLLRMRAAKKTTPAS